MADTKKYVSKVRINKNSANERDIAAKYVVKSDNSVGEIDKTYAKIYDTHQNIGAENFVAHDHLTVYSDKDGVLANPNFKEDLNIDLEIYSTGFRVYESEEEVEEVNLYFPNKSGTIATTDNLKTIQGQSIIGSGNIEINVFNDPVTTTSNHNNDESTLTEYYTDKIVRTIDTEDVEINFPDKQGTIALTSDLEDYVTKQELGDIKSILDRLNGEVL